MTEFLWERLTRVNAKGVATVSAALLVGVSFWSVLPKSPPRHGRVEPETPVAISPNGNAEKLQIKEDAGDPFQSAYLERILRAERAPVEPKPGKTAPSKVAASVPPAPVPPPWDLLYRGMVKRPDGKRLALIENRNSKSTSFFEPGSTIGPFTVHDMDRNSLYLSRADQRIELQVGVGRELAP